ncbi:MAG: type II toxin-antitoxin system RelE/ParE family toxin [Candidatus Micrarchaeota archaeon]|nr:type II toxin-antitoxin system RelE/ParE family toxin [Candidatus Micrarchaeota archaeon]
MALILSDEFQNDYRKIKDSTTKERIKKALASILENPDKGKNLHYNLKGKKSVRIGVYRIVYENQKSDIHILKLGYRKNVYE